MWSKWYEFEDKIIFSDWAESTKERGLNYLRRYKHFCGSEEPNMFLAAEFINSMLGDGTMSLTAYSQCRYLLKSVMGREGHFGNLGCSYVINRSSPDPKGVYDGLAHENRTGGVSCGVVFRIFSKESNTACRMAKLRDYDVDTSMFLGVNYIPSPFSNIVVSQRERVIANGGSEHSYFCPQYNRVSKTLDVYAARTRKSYFSLVKRMSAKHNVDFYQMITKPDSMRHYPPNSVIRYRTGRPRNEN